MGQINSMCTHYCRHGRTPFIPSVTAVPLLFAADATSGAASLGPALILDRSGSVADLIVCGSTLYFTVSHNKTNILNTSIVAAPFADPGAPTIVAELNAFTALHSCVP